jgi:hypothetical protein
MARNWLAICTPWPCRWNCSLHVLPVSGDVAQLHVPVQFTTGAAGQAAQVTRIFLNQVLVKSGGSWRVIGIFPIPAPAP